MKYEDLLNGNKKYGTEREDIIKRYGYEKILKNVVLAPWWKHDIFNNYNVKIEKVGDNLYNIYGDDFSFSFIELRFLGAPIIFDQVLALGVTNCKNLLFIGAVGSLDLSIMIGDIVVPQYSICGDGASRYLNENFADEFGKKEYPSPIFTKDLWEIVKKQDNINAHYVPNYSTDTIFAQFAHLESIIKMGASTIEMETSALFKCNELLNINMAALLMVSDNTVSNKSLFSGRTHAEIEYKQNIKYDVIPNIIFDLFTKYNK